MEKFAAAKAPGPDGVPIGTFKSCINLRAPILTQVCNTAAREYLPLSSTESIIF